MGVAIADINPDDVKPSFTWRRVDFAHTTGNLSVPPRLFGDMLLLVLQCGVIVYDINANKWCRIDTLSRHIYDVSSNRLGPENNYQTLITCSILGFLLSRLIYFLWHYGYHSRYRSYSNSATSFLLSAARYTRHGTCYIRAGRHHVNQMCFPSMARFQRSNYGDRRRYRRRKDLPSFIRQ